MRKNPRALKPEDFDHPYVCKRHGQIDALHYWESKRGYLKRRCPKCISKTYHRQYMREYNRKLRATARARVLAEYGGKCACCGEGNSGFLSVDHTYDDGHFHRQEFSSGAQIYLWLVKNGFPKDGFELACYNCNLGRANSGGICPHKSTVS